MRSGIAVLFGAALNDLNQMVAVRRADRIGNLTGLEFIHYAFKLRHRVTGLQPAEIAAARSSGVYGVQASHRSEVGFTRLHAILNVIETTDHIPFRRDIADEHENMAGMGLFDRAAANFA